MTAARSGGTEVVSGRYELGRELGRGGMGVVRRAWDRVLEREVAVKEVLLPEGLTAAERAETHDRVLREARSAARVAHPAVITVHDVLDHDDHPWVVMELVRGRSLQEHLDAHGPLAPSAALVVARTLLRALRAAHAKGVVHRDVKPGNVMLTDEGGVLLTDFGIATIEGGSAITRTGSLIGSPEYMAPERLQNERALPASDLWALGATLHAAVDGASPFQRGTVPAAIAAVLSAPVPPARNGGPLAPLIRGLLDRDVSRRLTAERALTLLDNAAPAASAPVPGTGPRQAPPRPGAGAAPPAGRPPHAPAPGGPGAPQPGGPGPGPAHTGGTPVGGQRGPSAAGVGGFGPGTTGRTYLIGGAAAVALVLVVLVASIVVASSAGDYESYTDEAYRFEFPSGWNKEGNADVDHVFADPSGQRKIFINSYELADPPLSSTEELSYTEDEIRDGYPGTFRRVGLTRDVPGGFPEDWDVAQLEIEFGAPNSGNDWSDPRRHYVQRVIQFNGRGYSITVNVPLKEADAHDAMRAHVLDAFRPMG